VFCSFSILYRISLFPFPFAVVCVFTFFFFRKICVGLCSFISMRCVTTYAFLFFSFSFLHSLPRFASPRLPIHSLLPARRPPPARSPVSIAYRIVLYYNTYPLLRLTDRLTNLLFVTSMVGTIYLSDRKAARSSVKNRTQKSPRSPVIASNVCKNNF